MRCGLAEAVKVSLIKDVDFFRLIEALADRLKQRDPHALAKVIHRCAKLHLQHIAGGDPFELWQSPPLDFGHWAAHKLEQLTKHRLRHGEAVAVGIALDCTYSYLVGMLRESDWRRILNLLLELGFSFDLSGAKIDDLLEGLNEFREHLGGQLTIMLLSAIGTGIEVHAMDTHLVMQSATLLSDYESSFAQGLLERASN